MTTSTMFLNNVTSIDHAFINATGWVYGGSVNPFLDITGKVDPKENVVVDFSTVKKSIKSIIDHKELGFDHKLWFIEGLANGTILFRGDLVTITTPEFFYIAPADSVRYIKSANRYDLMNEVIGHAVEHHLNLIYRDVDIKVECSLDVTPMIRDTRVQAWSSFKYTHGLKDSTSWGCQNMLHGHDSFIQINSDTPHAWMLVSSIATKLHNKMFVWDRNVVDDGIAYVADRGSFHFVVRNESLWDRMIILNTETTIEHIVEYVANQWREELKSVGATKLYVSEGQNKGAVVNL